MRCAERATASSGAHPARLRLLRLEFLDGAVRHRFLHRAHRAMLLVDRDPEALLAAFRAYRPPPPFKWVDRPAR